jgi:hypothetical protein
MLKPEISYRQVVDDRGRERFEGLWRADETRAWTVVADKNCVPLLVEDSNAAELMAARYLIAHLRALAGA